MRRRQTFITKALLGGWLICLVGPCLALPLYQGLDPVASSTMAMTMEGAAEHHQGCDSDTATECDGTAFPTAFLPLFAVALPLIFWAGISRSRATLFRPASGPQGLGTGPPVYLLSQRFLE